MSARRVLCVALVLGAGCAPYEIDDTRRQVMQSWADDMLLPAYRDAALGADALADAIDALCAAPSDETLAAARVRWSGARAPWKQTEVFGFGPYQDEPLRFGPKIDAWPGRPDTVQAVLDADFAVTPAAVDGLGSFARGFPALEYLLFEPDGAGAAGFADPRRCDYARSLAVNLGDELRGLHDAWSPEGGDYLGELVGAGSTGTEFDGLSDALGEVVNRMGYTVENIGVDKLGRPLGQTAGGAPQPEVVESRWSGRSLDDIADNLRGIERLFAGDADTGALGLSTYLAAHGHVFDARMQGALGRARTALAAIDPPLTDAVALDAADVASAIAALRELQRFIQADILDALSLTLGFNDADGD